MQVTIVDAEPADAETILAVQRLAYQDEAAIYDDYTIPPLVETADALRARFGDHVVLKAVVEGRIVGAVQGVLRDRTCHIGRLVVHPEFQNRGIGTLLIEAIEGRFAGADRFELFTGTKSLKNLHLYERRGYRPFKTARQTERVMLVYLEKTASGED